MDDLATRLHYTQFMPFGAEITAPDTVSFRVWAPGHTRVAVCLEDGEARALELAKERGGYFSGTCAGVPCGTRYRYRLDDDSRVYPDPASRSQPAGHDGPSEVIDPRHFSWTDGAWRGVALRGQVIYEMHIGTFTREGTWRAAMRELEWLAGVGITVLEIMPVGEFPGRFGWGYDAVHFFAPSHLYGTPDDMRAFVDRAHALGMGVILDVVYNHCAAFGCFLDVYTRDYFSARYRNEWGHALNFDGENSEPVRAFILANAAYWLTEFHVDGFRFDATQQMFDASHRHILRELSAHCRSAARGRDIVLIAENEPQHARLVADPESGGYGLDALWNDDFHHAARVAVTGCNEAYYSDYRGSPQEFISAVKRGFLYQGQHYTWQKSARGTPAHWMRPEQFVTCIENHDQVANSVHGHHIHRLTTPGRCRALTALLLLAPQTPMLFQGQEFAASSPFLYFADHEGLSASAARKGRADFLSQFPHVASAGRARLPDPVADDTFERCKLEVGERSAHAEVVSLHRDLIALRRGDSVFSAQRPGSVDGAVLGAEAFVLRFLGNDGDDRLLIVNFGVELSYSPMPEPLLAPPAGRRWRLLWSSEDIAYGGSGTPAPCEEAAYRIPAHAALVLTPAA